MFFPFILGFLQFWGIVFTITTTLVTIFKRESDDEEDTVGIISTYKLLLKIVRLPAVLSLISILLTAKVMYHILPIKGALPNKGASHSLEEANSIIHFKNTCSFLNNCRIFYPKPALESSQYQFSPHTIRCDLANVPGALISGRMQYYYKIEHSWNSPSFR